MLLCKNHKCFVFQNFQPHQWESKLASTSLSSHHFNVAKTSTRHGKITASHFALLLKLFGILCALTVLLKYCNALKTFIMHHLTLIIFFCSLVTWWWSFVYWSWIINLTDIFISDKYMLMCPICMLWCI